jgi:two-component system, NarL family, sensor kinase
VFTENVLINNQSFDSISTGVSALMILIFSIIYLFSRIKYNTNPEIFKIDGSFLVVSSIIIYFSGTFFIYILSKNNYFDENFRLSYSLINALVLIVRNILILTAFITELKPYLKKETFTHTSKYSNLMPLLQTISSSSNVSTVLFFGTLGMLVLAIGLVVFIVFHQRKVIKYQQQLQRLEDEQQQILLNASIRWQEEERQRIAADLHDDAGPLLATARLYLNDNLVHQDISTQLQSIYNAKQIIDDTIQLIRNISHSLMPPTLKNFGLESAINDLFQKISGSGAINASCRFHDYRERMLPQRELLIFRVAQELVNNILKHSNSSFIHLTQNTSDGKFYIRLHHDGKGITQADFERMNKSSAGLGLKNIQSRMKVLDGSVFFEKDASQTFYKVTLEMPVSDTTSL